ncbi:MAG: carboxypeptidase regulatory-like domain-containing protein, partial [Caldilineaceae bacterium]|nr:carboxypeptidase regulatory-like domain-containing protein [Caldilineaceae bacterium]
DYAPEFYNNAETLEQATTITVAVGAIVDNIDVQVQPFGQIKGTVTDINGQPIENASVLSYRFEGFSNVWHIFTTATTDAAGNYIINGLATNNYRLEFRGPCCGERYRAEFYQNATQIDAAADIAIQTGQMLTGIDAQLDRNGEISGRVSAENGQGLSGIVVDVLHQLEFPGGPIWTSSGSAYTDGDGFYTIYGLANDNYRVRFNYDRVDGYVPAYWQDTLDFDKAITLPVIANGITTGIDAHLTKGGSIGGTARTADGRTYYIRIVLYQYRFDAMGEDPWYPLRTLFYDGNSFIFDGLDAGVYRLGFFDDQDPGYHKEFYPDQPYVETAQSFTIALGQQISDIDVVLDWPGDTAFPPRANDDVVTLFEGSRTTRLDTFDISLLHNDKDDWENPTIPLTATLVSLPQHGQVTVAEDGQFSYQHDGSDTTADHFTYQAHDLLHASNVATVTINVVPVNEKPYAIADRIAV